MADQLADLPTLADLLPLYWHLLVKNGNFTFLLLELILADLPPVVASSGQEWQFYIATVRAHIGRSSGRSAPQVDLPVDLNGNFRFLLLRAHMDRSAGRCGSYEISQW